MPHVFGRDTCLDARWLHFLQTPELSHDQRRLALAQVGTCLEAATALLTRVANRGFDTASVDRLLHALNRPWYGGDWPVQLVHIGESAYPDLLRACSDAPPALFCLGDLSLFNSATIALVGTRKPSGDGRRLAFQTAGDLGGLGFLVASGLAGGIDGEVHRGALHGGGPTLAVMATGIDRIYPQRHRGLAAEIVANGLLVSEFLPGCDPMRWHFPRRNRTLSGLAQATVVVEAGKPSGTLITAAAAGDQGRDVMAFPWSVYHRQGVGCCHLLLQGATPVTQTRDILASLGVHAIARLREGINRPAGGDPKSDGGSKAESFTGGSGTTKHEGVEAEILDFLGDATCELPALAQALGQSEACLRRSLSRLELDGRVEATLLGYRQLNRAR